MDIVIRSKDDLEKDTIILVSGFYNGLDKVVKTKSRKRLLYR